MNSLGAKHTGSQQRSLLRRLYRPLIVSGLLAAGLFQVIPQVLAAGTAANTTISNTATATYEDPDGNDFTAESNTVTVTVAKIAGITNVPTAFNNLGDLGNSGAGAGGTILTGHSVEFIYTVTNTGNDLSNIFIPAATTLTTTGLTNVVLEYSLDGGTTYTAVPTGGFIAPNIAVDGQVLVRATGVVTATAAGAPISVRLGNTGSNTAANAPAVDTQNQPDSGLQSDGVTNDTGVEPGDIRTETATTPTVAGAPANGQREASALAQQFLGSNPLALARIEKTNAGIADPNVTPTDLSDDTITYNLGLDVLTVSPDPAYIPADLEGRAFNDTPGNTTNTLGSVTGVTPNTNLILVSDAIPTNTALSAIPTPPTNWTVVYTTNNPATVDANDADWTTTPPASLSTVTRIGWVYDAGTNGPIAQGTTVSGFTFTVVTSGVGPSGTTIANIAQVYGSTDDGTTGVSGTPIFDESGDQDPSNFSGSTPGPTEDDPESDGVGDPGNHGTDSNNNNSVPNDPGGEDNVVSVVPPGTILNGPGGFPGATGNVFGVGPDNNHDFQNQATLPTGTDTEPDVGTTVDPAPMTFNNTLSNPDPTNALTGVLLQPIQPSFAGGTNTDLPVGTTVRIDVTINGTPTFAEYTYTGTGFNITNGSPILIPNISPGVTLNYTTQINLPAGTPLSTDQIDGPDGDTLTGDGDTLVGGFPVPIIAFIDGDSDGTPDPGETSNITVDQVYTGFLRLVKQSRVLQGTGPAVAAADAAFSIADKVAAPGNIIEYRVIYRNISEAQAGSGTNDILSAQNVVITENGTVAPNNWALDLNPTDGFLDTINVQNSAATTSTGATINYATGNPAVVGGTIDPGTTTTGYQLTVPSVAPTGAVPISAFNVATTPIPTGFFSFTFQRTVSDGTTP